MIHFRNTKYIYIYEFKLKLKHKKAKYEKKNWKYTWIPLKAIKVSVNSDLPLLPIQIDLKFMLILKSECP